VRWEKVGRIFEPAGRAPWMATHAAHPVAWPAGGSRYRIYCSGRDAQGRSQVGAFELDLADPKSAGGLTEQPLVGLGELGAFDESGVVNACIVDAGDALYQYVVGWQLLKTVPFTFSSGLAISRDGGASWAKHSRGPLMDRNEVDPFLNAASSVMRDGAVWRMWYTSGVRWAIENGIPKHYYHIKYAESQDGIAWQRTGKVCVDFNDGEYAIGRPCVVLDGGLYRMWFSYRGAAYRIGYAESRNGTDWTRLDERAGIDVSPDGWDSEMICYASVFRHGDDWYMLYNGNGYGKTGIGLARRVE